MRERRIKVDARLGEAAYHCMTRTVNGERLFDDPAKEILRRQLWLVADYCGVEIITYAILANHFHVLVRVPQRAPVADAELLRRYAVLYPRPTRYQAARLDVIKRQLATDGPEALAWRRRQLALMGEVSPFMKLVKQRFSIWFNKSHQRFGTLWAERFKSTLVEPKDQVLETMAAYLDLNCVRAGLAADPKDYRFCGYAEAVAGHVPAQKGLSLVAGAADWADGQAGYRQTLFGTGAGPREQAGGISPVDLARVIKEGGQLPLATVLRCRVRYFTDGGVLGSRAFVEAQLVAYRHRTGRRQRTTPRLLPPLTDWGEMAVLRGLRGQPIG